MIAFFIYAVTHRPDHAAHGCHSAPAVIVLCCVLAVLLGAVGFVLWMMFSEFMWRRKWKKMRGEL